MRLRTALAVSALLVVAGCGGDDPEPAPATRPQPQAQQPRVDTTLGDTATVARPQGQVSRPGAPGTTAPGQPGQPGQQAQRPGGQAGQPGQPSGAAPSTGAASGQRLYTVQVAAFASPDSARKWTGRLNSLNLPVWTSMQELGGQTYYRVRVGAVPTVAEARRLGGILSSRFEWPVWVAPVTPADQLPQDAVNRTRSVLEGG